LGRGEYLNGEEKGRVREAFKLQKNYFYNWTI
jgi:hypothetical protein